MGTTRIYSTRGRSLEEAAAHTGFGKTKFEEMVKLGDMPEPHVHGGRCVWDVYELDEAFDALPRRNGITVRQVVLQPHDPWSDMRAR